jgi:hypothetical protein
VLCLLDDGADSGEEIRIRSDRLILGRTEGDVSIPHDDSISGRHAEIVRLVENGRSRWYVQDLGSTNGTFARVDEALLRHQQEMILGSRRYRFDASSQPAAALPTADAAAERKVTSAWQAVSAPEPDRMRPALVELKPGGEGCRLVLPGDDQFVGTDAGQCAVVLPEDPLADARLARLYRDKYGRWILKSMKAANGVWVRIKGVEVMTSGQFQIGEQRFTVRIP